MNMRWLFLSQQPEQTDIFGRDIRQPHKKPKGSTTPQSHLETVLERKKGLLFVPSGSLLQYNVSRCTDLNLFRARHVHEVEMSNDTIYVRLDAAQRGLGTGSCGPSTLPKYQINGGKYEINFWIKPLGFGNSGGSNRCQ